MSYALPSSDSPLREVFDIRDLVDIGTRKVFPTSFRDALSSGRKYVQECADVRAVHSICVRGDGTLVLIRIGKRGGWKELWRFGRM